MVNITETDPKNTALQDTVLYLDLPMRSTYIVSDS